MTNAENPRFANRSVHPGDDVGIYPDLDWSAAFPDKEAYGADPAEPEDAEANEAFVNPDAVALQEAVEADDARMSDPKVPEAVERLVARVEAERARLRDLGYTDERIASLTDPMLYGGAARLAIRGVDTSSITTARSKPVTHLYRDPDYDARAVNSENYR